LRSERMRLIRGQVLAEVGAGSLAVVATGLAIVWMAWRVTQGLASLGDVALFYQVFTQGQRLMRTLLENVGDVYRNMLFLENLFEFLALEPQVHEPEQPVPFPIRVQVGIRFEAVTFRYPESERLALDHFSVEIPAGQMVAFVGANGAGKSTLIKLLCRFYDPDGGRITVDGIDLRDILLDDLRRQITVLFQEPVRYHTTAAENIALGDLAARPTMAAIAEAAQAAGAEAPILHLPQQFETVLGKWFGGAELSVGEWQRIALARAFLRHASLLILDEPTSAMDSWAEADWLTRFRRLAAGRTTIIITHRFTTAMQADYIYVMEGGRVVEAGTHSSLLALNGRYGQSWRTQMLKPHNASV
jgi:ATP-binding cassette subfamily B protein